MQPLDTVIERLKSVWSRIQHNPDAALFFLADKILDDLELALPPKKMSEPEMLCHARGVFKAHKSSAKAADRWKRDGELCGKVSFLLELCSISPRTVHIDAWREIPHYELKAQRQVYRDFLLDVTRPFLEGAEEDWIIAHEGNSLAALMIALQILKKYGREHRLLYPWLAAAGLRHDITSEIGGILVGCYLQAYERTQHLAADWFGPQANPSKIGNQAKMWPSFARPLLELMPPDILMLADSPSASNPAPIIGTRSSYEAETPQLIVVQAIGDNLTDDGKRLEKSWGCLTQPLPPATGIEPKLLHTVLSSEFPWMMEAIDAITDDLSLRRSNGILWAHWRPILLAGPPGTGKTRFAHRVAGLMGMGFGEISGAGSSDNRALQGTARGWSSASPSYVLHVIRQTRCTNPVILVDEIDKAAIGNTNGDIRSTLLAMLEPTTAKTWQDECLMASCNLSAVNWILTANDTSKLRGPLLTRLRVISVQAPTIDHFPSVLQSIRRDLASELKISTADLAELSPLAEAHLRKAFARDFSLRRIRAAVESAVKATKRIERLAH